MIDAIGRSWQLSTFQFDFSLPGRFDVCYTDAESKPRQVVMIHRALLGSLERFMGVLIEHYGGAFPVWLAPVQAVVVPVADRHHEYAERVAAELLAAGARCETDLRKEKVGYKIREAQLAKVPFMLVVGDREQQLGTVAVRSRSEGDLGASQPGEFLARLQALVSSRAVRP
jgi:threonyl-tRNA synthetase